MLALQVLKEHKVYVKFSKCEFSFRSVAFLEHVISGEGEEVDLKKTDIVRNWRRPLTPTDLKSFLGLDVYHRRFADGFALIDSLLTTLTQQKVKFEWSESCEKGFLESKDKVTSTPVLTLPEGNEGLVVY